MHIGLYNFGSPRVGDFSFAREFNKLIPDAFRTVVDGDLVTAVPSFYWGFQHIGVEVLVDANESGSIIIDPSFVERRLRTHTKSSVAAHSLIVYRQGIESVKRASEFLKSKIESSADDRDVDLIRLAIQHLRDREHKTQSVGRGDTRKEGLETTDNSNVNPLNNSIS